MCGIVGCAGLINRTEAQIFRDMLLLDVVRGQDSTGILRIGLGDAIEPQIFKDVGHPLNLWDFYSDYAKEFDHRGVIKGHSKILLGHNRAATVGDVNVDNAHPFKFGPVYGVHNGSLYHTYELEGNLPVDSMEVYNTIHLKGIDYTWERLYGAAALVWWDQEKKRLFMIRNNERPLYTAFDKDGKTLFWASEPWMINVSMGRHKKELAKNENNVYIQPKQLELDTLYEYEVSAIRCELKETRKLKKRTAQTNVGFTGTRGGAGHKKNTTKKEKRGKLIKINQGWASGLLKADKEMRGSLVKIKCCLQTFEQKTGNWNYTIVGELVGTRQRIEIVPSTIADFEKIRKVKDGANGGDVFYKLNARPRYKFNGNTNIAIYYVSSECVGLQKIVRGKATTNKDNIPDSPKEESQKANLRGYGWDKYTKEQLQKNIKEAGGTCLACDNVLTVDDHESIDWVNENTMLCSTCSEDPYVQSIARGMV